MIKVFIDGREGTTGLQIEERLSFRPDVELLSIAKEKRKDVSSRKECLNQADVVFLCLPDEAAKESVSLIENPNTIVIDASTAHRTNPAWAYGLPELSSLHRQNIQKRIANPGCHATGFIVCVYPLLERGFVEKEAMITCTSLTGYSGGGKSLIAQYEQNSESFPPRPYALGLVHKHLPEMKVVTGLHQAPHFYPVVGNMRQGMLVSVPLFATQMTKPYSALHVHDMLLHYYAYSNFIKVMPFGGENCLEAGFLNPTTCNNTNRLELFVFGHETQTLLVARFDNLGKGASGAAVQNMNIACGLPEDVYLS